MIKMNSILKLIELTNSKIEDIVIIVLGSMTPMIIRSLTTDGKFQVVGECYTHGIMDGESLLGQLPPFWEVRPVIDMSNGVKEPAYWNSETNSASRDDPRLGELPAEWERITQRRTPDDPILFAPHRNKLTGEIINSDPRMLPNNLRKRGINLEMFPLV